MFYKGDILLPRRRLLEKDKLNGLFHAAVVWDDFNDGHSDFNGIMLTRKGPNRYFDNIIMAQNHFDLGFKFGFNNTHFVNQIFIKLTSWGPFDIKGKLTQDGITFIENNLTNLNPIDFVTYEGIIFKRK